MENNLKIIFLGTPDFARPILQALIANRLEPVLVITQPDKPVGRKHEMQMPPIKLEALKNNIEVIQPTNQKELKEAVTKIQPDVCILVAFGMIIKKEILEIPKFGFINIHPSLLPLYRGSSPLQTAILNSDNKTGVSIMLLDEKMDHGPIIAQESLSILSTDNNITLHDRLASLGADLLIKILPDYLAGNIKPEVQNDSLATYTKMISKQDGQINWHNNARQIEAQFRALQPWPGIFTYWQGKRLKIANLSLTEADNGANLTPGSVFLLPDDSLAVVCFTGAVKLNRLQLEGKKELSGHEFARGYKEFVGSQLI